jgi:tripartite-type tricarboxylate transporter receptor subunit TctC
VQVASFTTTDPSMILTRRLALLGLGLAAAAPIPGWAAANNVLTIVEPYGPGSSVRTPLDLLRAPLARSLDRPVELVEESGEAGGRALDRVATASPDGTLLLATQILSPYAIRSERQPPVSLRELTPIAKLSNAISAALIVAPSSPIRSWADFEKTAKQRPLTLAWNPVLVLAAPLGMLEHGLGVRFADVRALDSGRADAAFLPTVSLLSDWPNLKANALLTFGGERHALLASQVPTWREVSGGGKVTAVTGSVGAFGPPGLPDARAQQLTDAFLAAGTDPTAVAQAADHHFPLAVTGPDVLLATMERDARVIGELAPYIRQAPG